MLKDNFLSLFPFYTFSNPSFICYQELKGSLYEMLESVNDGIRTHCVKFLEGLALVCSRRTAESEIPKKNENDVSLDQIPKSNGIVAIDKLDEDGTKAFVALLQFQSSPHISR